MSLSEFFGADHDQLSETKVGTGISAKLRKSLMVGGLAMAMLAGSQATLAGDSYGAQPLDVGSVKSEQIVSKMDRFQATTMLMSVKGQLASNYDNTVNDQSLNGLAMDLYEKHDMGYFEAYSLVSDYVDQSATQANDGNPVFNDLSVAIDNHVERSQLMFGSMDGYEVMQALAEFHNDLADYSSASNPSESDFLKMVNEHVNSHPDIPEDVWGTYLMEYSDKGSNIHPKDIVDDVRGYLKDNPDIKLSMNDVGGSQWHVDPDHTAHNGLDTSPSYLKNLTKNLDKGSNLSIA